jgi:hypothetical protein
MWIYVMKKIGEESAKSIHQSDSWLIEKRSARQKIPEFTDSYAKSPHEVTCSRGGLYDEYCLLVSEAV